MTAQPSIAVAQAPLEAIVALREEYRREMDCQIVHDSWHRRGFTNSYLCRIDGEIVGYGSVGGVPREPKHSIKEFYLRPPARQLARPLFRQLVAASGVRAIETQTNDRLLTMMFFDCADDWQSETVLFADEVTTALPPPAGVELRQVTEADRATVFKHAVEPVGDWGLEYHGELAATGGLFFHYNQPYGDVYMEVAPRYRRKGFASYLVQFLNQVACERASQATWFRN